MERLKYEECVDVKEESKDHSDHDSFEGQTESDQEILDALMSLPGYTRTQQRALNFAIKENIEAKHIKFLYQKNFNEKEMEEAILGFSHQLSLKDVEIYYLPGFNSSQMNMAREALERKVSPLNVEFFYRREYTWLQMALAVQGLTLDGLTLGDVSLYYYSHYHYDLMKKQKELVVSGKMRSTPKLIRAKDVLMRDSVRIRDETYEKLKSLSGFTDKQKHELELAFISGQLTKYIESYYKPKYNAKKMKQARLGYDEGLSMEQVFSYLDSDLSIEDMKKRRLELVSQNSNKEFNMSIKEHVDKMLLLPGYDEKKKRVLKEGYDRGLSLDKLKFLYDTGFDDTQMSMALTAFTADLSISQVQVFWNSDLSEQQMFECFMGYHEGLTKDDVRSYCKVDMSCSDMKTKREELKKSLNAAV